MARRSRNILADFPFHVSLRGNNRQPVFLCDQDRLEYKVDLQAACTEHGLAVHGYVLLPAEVHIIATPRRPDSLALAMQAVGRRYVRSFNRRHQRSGSLWEGRYRASIIQESYLLCCLSHLEREPQRAGLAAALEDYPWSSHRHHLGLEIDALVIPHYAYWGLGNTPFEREAAYRQYVEGDPGNAARVVAAAVAKSRPIADPQFLLRVETETGTRLAVKLVGRPRKVPLC